MSGDAPNFHISQIALQIIQGQLGKSEVEWQEGPYDSTHWIVHVPKNVKQQYV